VKPLRCLIAGVPQIILADIVQRIVQENKNIEVVAHVSDIEDVLNKLNGSNINVLIIGMKSNNTPQIYRDIQSKFSDLLIIGLVDDGRQAIIYLDDVGCNEIVQAIKIFGKTGKD